MFAALILTGAFCAGQSVMAQAVGSGDVLFSEFRLSGPNGFADEYMELYCNRDTNCDISNYNIIAFDESSDDFAVTFPASTIIPARGHLLVGDNAGYSLTGYANLDLLASSGGETDFFIDNQGFQLTNADRSVVIDSVGFDGGGGTVTYIEGTGLQPATGARPADQYAYVRQLRTGTPQDTNNNAADFVLVSVTATPQPGITTPPTLGAPGPQNTASPIQRNGRIKASLFAPWAPATGYPNRIRRASGNPTSAAFGTLELWRKFTNRSGGPITVLRFRTVDMTTRTGTTPPPAGTADLRIHTSYNHAASPLGYGLYHGTRLETPAQPNGGGLNSSMVVDIGGGTFADNQTIDVRFVLGVQQEGNFRFLVNIEAANSVPALASQTKSAASKGRAMKAVEPLPSPLPPSRMMSERKRVLSPSGQLVK
jgi:hypothetical protein